MSRDRFDWTVERLEAAASRLIQKAKPAPSPFCEGALHGVRGEPLQRPSLPDPAVAMYEQGYLLGLGARERRQEGESWAM